jgi:CDGSH-type Zn-finger protein
MDETTRIECRPDGPYKVTNLKDLRDANGASLPTETVVALCRCGGSARKPFCDGTHKRNGFSGARLGGGPPDRVDDYRGRAITIHDNRSVCAHAGLCTDHLASVFKYGSEPWIDPDGASAEAIVAAVERCPSGALSYTLAGKGPDPRAHACRITVTRDGPYAVEGAVELAGVEFGRGAPRERFTLCRCGGSKNKPFCDGTHWEIGFKDGPR